MLHQLVLKNPTAKLCLVGLMLTPIQVRTEHVINELIHLS